MAEEADNSQASTDSGRAWDGTNEKTSGIRHERSRKSGWYGVIIKQHPRWYVPVIFAEAVRLSE